MVLLSSILRNIQNVNPLYYHPKPNAFEFGNAKHLPEAYRKFYREWRVEQRTPVHYIPKEGKWEMKPTGEVVPIQDVPLPLLYLPQMENGIWGGEWVVQGFKKKHPKKAKVPYFWIPKLINGVVYSEVLNKHMKAVVTPRAIKLISENFGLDHYLLKTRACDLVTMLSLKLKRKLLFALYYKTLYPEDEEKRNVVYDRYKHYLANYTEEEIQWYGLSLVEAGVKIKFMMECEEENSRIPLKHQYRVEFINKLKSCDPEDLWEIKEKPWWRKTLFPF